MAKRMSMSKSVPPGAVYVDRGNAVDAMKLANLQCSGHNIGIDGNGSGKKRVTMRCGSSFQLADGQKKGKKVAACHLAMTGFTCTRRADEKKLAFQQRRLSEAEQYAISLGHCPFKAVANKIKIPAGAAVVGDDGGGIHGWTFKKMKNGNNFIGHREGCTEPGKAKGNVLTMVMKEAIHANPHMSNKKASAAIAGHSSSILSLANLPSKSAMYRAQFGIKHEELAFYDHGFARC